MPYTNTLRHLQALIVLLALMTVAVPLRAADDEPCTVYDTVSESYTLCRGDSLLWHGQTIRFSGTNSINESFTTADGQCDSIVTYLCQITIPTTAITGFEGDSTLCAGTSSTLRATLTDSYRSIVWRGPLVTGLTTDTITVQAGGIYTATVTDSNGCLSADTMSVRLVSITRRDTSVAHCAGTPYIIDGDEYTESTTHRSVYSSVEGCDSIVIYHLTIMPQPELIVAGIHPFCEGDTLCIAVAGAESYEWSTGETSHMLCITSGGTYSLTATGSNGCTAVREFDMPTFATKTRHHYDTICSGQIRSFFGRELTERGTYQVYDTTYRGCDSSDVLHLEIKPLLSADIALNASDSLFWGSTWRTATGTYSKTDRGSNGCDSTTRMHLLVVHGAPLPRLVLIDERTLALDHYQPYHGDTSTWHGYIAYRWYRDGHLLRTAHRDYYHSADYSPLAGCYHAEIAVNDEQTLWMRSDTICLNLAAINDITQQLPTLSPNPAAAGSVVTIASLCRELTLTTLDGHPIAVSHATNTMNLPSSLASGLYLLRATLTDGTAIAYRLIVR